MRLQRIHCLARDLMDAVIAALRLLHITAGSVALLFGAIALIALKGGRVHRKSGMIFVFAMLVMAALGAVMAAFKPERISVLAGALTFYLVTTALLTLRRGESRFRWTDAAATLVAVTLGVIGFKFGLDASNSPGGTLDGLPAEPAFMFGGVAWLAAIGDVRLMLARKIEGVARISRHLWRMCFALWIATSSFFLGQSQVFPERIRIMPLLATPVLLVLLAMFFWLIRIRLMKRYPRRT